MFESEGGVKEDTVHYIALSLPVSPKEKSIVRGEEKEEGRKKSGKHVNGKGTVQVRYYSSRELS